MKPTRLLASLCALCALSASAETLITPAAAYAENYYATNDRRPARAIDGSGLSPDGTTHSAERGDVWMGKQENGAGGTFARWFIVDLGAVHALSSVKIWNFNMADWTKRGIKQADFFVSTAEAPALDTPAFIGGDGSPDWTLVAENVLLAQAPGNASYTGLDPIDLNRVEARWFGIRIDSVFDANKSSNGGFGGLSEIRFYEVASDSISDPTAAITSPSSATLSATLFALDTGAALPVTLCYGTTPGESTPASWEHSLSLGECTNGTITAALSDLTPNTPYYAAFCIPTATEPIWSETLPFATTILSVTAPDPFYENDTATPHAFLIERPAACADVPLTVTYTLSGTATSGTDFNPLPESITFPAGETSLSLPIVPKNTNATEGHRTLTLSLTPGLYATDATSTATLTLLDDETDRRTCAWTALDPTFLWSAPANWSDEAVPRPIDAATFYTLAAPTVIVDSAASVYSIVTGSATRNPHFDIAADLTVANNWTLANSYNTHATVDHHDGTVRVSGTLQLGNDAANRVTYDLHGPTAALVTGKLYSNRYRSASADNLSYVTLRVRDGASLTATELSLTAEGAGNGKPPSYTDFFLLDGAIATLGTFNFAQGGLGRTIISNATLTANTLLARAWSYDSTFPSIDLYEGAIAHIGSISYCQYTSSNERMTQWPGSTVYAGSLKLAGSGQGGTGSATGILYEMVGGSLTVTNASIIGNNGNAELRLNGGTATFRSELAIDALRDLPDTEYKPSLLRLAGNASLEVLGQLTLQKNRGGRVAIELEGGSFTATAKKLASIHKDPIRISLRPRLTATGLAPLAITESISLTAPLHIEPSATPDAALGTYPILTWGTTLTGPETPFVLDLPENQTITYRLHQTPNALYLQASHPATLLMLR